MSDKLLVLLAAAPEKLRKASIDAARLQEIVDKYQVYEPHTGHWNIDQVRDMELTDVEIAHINAAEPASLIKRIATESRVRAMACALAGPVELMSGRTHELGLVVWGIMAEAAYEELLYLLNGAAEAARALDEEVRCSNRSFDDPGTPRESFYVEPSFINEH